MVQQFKGQVKISDIQEAFTEMVDRVNNIIDEYNTQAYVGHIDYTTGGTKLSPAGYSLTVGGLKQFLEAYKGCVIGSKAFKVSDTAVKMTVGMLVTTSGIVQLPDNVVAIDNSTKSIYFNLDTNTYSTTSSENTVKICDLNMNRDSKQVSTDFHISVEGIDGSYDIFTQDKNYTSSGKFIQWNKGYYENLDTSSAPKFVSGMGGAFWNGHVSEVLLFNTQVEYYRDNGDRRNQFYQPMNYLFIPKGVSNPYSYKHDGAATSLSKTNQKVLNVTISKKINSNSE